MKRYGILLMTLLLIAGCSSSKPAATTAPPVEGTPPPAASQPAPAPPPPAEPAEPVLSEGPLYLLPPPQKPLWGGPIAVVVENSPQSRPQVGLEAADLVVEMLAESEITRFLALYWSAPAAKIGPVRSARTGTVALADAYNAPFAHAGGNTDALAILQTEWSSRDLDDIYGGGAFFYRSSDRKPPHNLYTNTDLLAKAVTGRKLEMNPAPATRRAAPATAPAGGVVSKVSIRWHKLHQAEWKWESGRYLRYSNGEPHPLESAGQIAAANLVFLNITGENNGPDLGWTLDYKKGGKATVVTAGHSWQGSWTLEKGGLRLMPASGKVPLLAPGLTWVHLITQESSFELSTGN